MLKIHDFLLLFLVGISIAPNLPSGTFQKSKVQSVDEHYLICAKNVATAPSYSDRGRRPSDISDGLMESLSIDHILVKVDLDNRLVVWDRSVLALEKQIASLLAPSPRMKKAHKDTNFPTFRLRDTDVESAYFRDVTNDSDPPEMILYQMAIDRIDGSFTVRATWYEIYDQKWQRSRDGYKGRLGNDLLYAGVCKKYDAMLRVF